MANFSPGVVITDIRGKVGSAVFTKARSGSTIRVRVKPANPRSSAQSTVRSNMTNASRDFKAFSSSQVAAWAAFAGGITKHNAVSGAAYHPSAINAYMSLALDYLQGTPGGTPPTAPPTTPYTGDTITITAVGASGHITWTGSAQQGAGQKTIFLAQLLASANRTPSPKAYRVIDVAAIPATPFQITTNLPAGTYAIGYKYLKTATGQTTEPVYLGTVTVS